ncbi:type II toxin-antitoxin system VapC family toxin [Subtercola frigoramans]|uniref:Ribonuclease VapC n=1 Tax=Subtercola frigoramans TaxID=120298 RepID=A0ABS2L518_9MICO|nr:type II toxin-antitoxin system VapC family toxin [Subtercola frigoramans]MBM7471830.1 ribonuclease VapC [Subtercola frigoramans]
MIVDTSAVVAIVTREPGFELVLGEIESADTISMSAGSVLELMIVLGSARFGLQGVEIQRILDVLTISTVEFTAEHASVAAEAFARFGKGHHPARLNFGDCMAYATAAVSKQPLLFVGDDFSQTDVATAR